MQPCPNRVLLSLAVAMLAALWGLDAVSVAPNRIVAGTGYPLWQAFGWPGAGLATLLPVVMAVLATYPVRHRDAALLAVSVLLLALMPFGLMLAAHGWIKPGMPQARLSLGPACWTVLFLLSLCLVELRLKMRLARSAMALWLAGVAGVWWLCAALWLEPLALVQEFQARSALFYRALGEHLALVGVAVGTSIVLGIATALLIRRFSVCQPAAFALLNFLQTVPSLALFGLLLAPLAWLGANVEWLAALGVSGIGWTPALLALTIYSLLPVVRNTCIALEAVNPAVLDAASGMGMRPAQRFWQVRLPLALPVLLEGVRITTVQAIGLTAVAALIGAGGLGDFIFQGLGQAAMDMVLLGALPIIAMALIADALLGALADIFRREAIRQGDAL
ncbi:ABC transporter permease [Halomonas cibimaris]